MANFKIYQGGDAYNDVKLGGESFGVACEFDEIEWEIYENQSRFTVKLPISKMSPHTKYLYENDQLGVTIIIENTRLRRPRDGTLKTNNGDRKTANDYHPYWSRRHVNIYYLDHMSDQIENGVNIPYTFGISNCSNLKFILKSRKKAGKEPTGYINYKVMLCNGNGRGYKTSKTITKTFTLKE